MAGKRGQEELMLFIIYILVAISILFSLMYFVSGVASGRLVKSQVLAKEIALFIDTAEPGTSILLEHEKADVKINAETKEVIVQIEQNAYVFKFFSPNSIEFETNQTSTKIMVK